MGLTNRQADDAWNALHIGAKVEFECKSGSGSGEVVRDGPAEVYVVQISWKTFAISEYGLRNDNYTKLVINGKSFT